MKKLFFCFVILFFSIAFSNAQVKKYCYSTYSGKYVMTLHNDGSNKAIYQLYNNRGLLQKTMQGIWLMQDEGVYGSAYMITITWTGLNSNLSKLKFIANFDGNGKLNAITDGESRIWNYCL
jgi:hypothetical protein